MNILGLNCYGHDSSAALLKDGNLVFAIEEERLNRIKHSGSFPLKSIYEAINFSNIRFNDIDHITFSWDPYITYSKIPIYALRYWRNLPTLLRERKNFSMEENLGMLNYLNEIRNIPNIISKEFKVDKNNFKFHLLEHHLCHAASCYYTTDFEEAAILTIDGAGEWSSVMCAHGVGTKINKLSTIDTPFSIGAFYQSISRYLGFKLIEGPGKLMGLASYGKRDTDIYRKLRNLFKFENDGKFRMDMSYFNYHYSRNIGITNKFINEFGPSNKTGLDWSTRELNIAAASQRIVEELVLHILINLKKKIPVENLCMAGGVALNSVTNGLIVKSGLFRNIFIQPAAGDSGTSIGGALYLQNSILKKPRKFIQKDSFLGPFFNEQNCKEVLINNNLNFKKIDNSSLNSFLAKKLMNGNIIGWFQGRMEFGPRALGNRSILASPLISNMKDILNSRVKYRESFRPFAAIVPEEDVGLYFDCSYKNEYMLVVYNVKEEYRNIFPSITHIDNSVRIQTVNNKDNKVLYDLLLAFREETGFSLLINTSFNIKGEPIVCSPNDAVNSFISSDIDILVMGNLISIKNELI